MITKTITYEDFEGNSHTEVFHFALTKTDIIDFQMKFPEGLLGRIEMLQSPEAQNGPVAYNLFKDIIAQAYGKQVFVDGVKKFDKDENTYREFLRHPAMGELIIEFLEDSSRADEFMNALAPRSLREQAAKLEAQNKSADGPSAPVAPPAKKFEDYSRQELVEMPQEQFDALLPDKTSEMTKDQLSIAMQRSNTQ